MKKEVVLTGLRANNNLHIGNYLGALLPVIDFAKEKAGEYQVNVFVPDLHSFTTPIDHSTFYESIIETVRTYIALGLPVENEDVYIYRQSRIPAHSELTWILSCFTGVGEMGRMTQFKDKSKKLRKNNTVATNDLEESDTATHLVERNDTYEFIKSTVSVGLFSYPILMATDILLYDATYIPVGDDQTQHLEFTRDIAQRMNKRFSKASSELFTVPKSVAKQHEFFGQAKGLRIRDLLDPTKKMSKSDDTGKGVVFLTDTPDEARKKIMSATTDSLESINYDPENQPGISNLLDIYVLFGGDEEEYIGQKHYGPFKSAVADVVCAFLNDHQEQKSLISVSDIENILSSKEQTISNHAEETLARVQTSIGLRK